MSITAWRAQERLKLEQLFIYSGDGKLRVDTLSPTVYLLQPSHQTAHNSCCMTILQRTIFLRGTLQRDYAAISIG